MKLVRHTGEYKGSYVILVRKAEGKWEFWRLTHGEENNIKMGFK
jgi:hypothetical protein